MAFTMLHLFQAVLQPSPKSFLVLDYRALHVGSTNQGDSYTIGRLEITPFDKLNGLVA
jgi:hypothetical protein